MKREVGSKHSSAFTEKSPKLTSVSRKEEYSQLRFCQPDSGSLLFIKTTSCEAAVIFNLTFS